MQSLHNVSVGFYSGKLLVWSETPVCSQFCLFAILGGFVRNSGWVFAIPFEVLLLEIQNFFVNKLAFPIWIKCQCQCQVWPPGAEHGILVILDYSQGQKHVIQLKNSQELISQNMSSQLQRGNSPELFFYFNWEMSIGRFSGISPWVLLWVSLNFLALRSQLQNPSN